MKGSRKSITPFLVPSSKRSSPVRLNSPAAAAAAADVQGAVVEKGIEVMGKMVDKQLQIIDEAQEKAENFLKKKVRRVRLLICPASRVLHFASRTQKYYTSSSYDPRLLMLW